MDELAKVVKSAEARLSERAAEVAQQRAEDGPAYCAVHQHYKWCNHNGGVRGVNGYGPPGTESAADSMAALIAWLRAQVDFDERIALLALQGHNVTDPANMRPELRAARWWSDYERLSVIVGDKQVEMCEIAGANWHAAHHIYLHQPQRVLREVEAKRRILDEVVPEINAMDDRIEGEWGTSGDALHDETWLLLRIMTLPYADRDGLREEWKP